MTDRRGNKETGTQRRRDQRFALVAECAGCLDIYCHVSVRHTLDHFLEHNRRNMRRRGLQNEKTLDRDAKRGQTLGALLELPLPATALRVNDDASAVLSQSRGAVVMHATSSFLSEVVEPVETCLRYGHDVISIAEEMTFAAAAAPGLAARLDEAARANGVRLLGTGVNPGFAMDMLVLALTVPCGRVDRIHARRTNDLSDFGPSVLRGQGVGLSDVEFSEALTAGTVVGHVGFAQYIALIAAHLGWTIDRIEETRAPILSSVPRNTPWLSIEPGQVAGCLHCASAWSGGQEVLRLEHPQQIRLEAEGVCNL